MIKATQVSAHHRPEHRQGRVDTKQTISLRRQLPLVVFHTARANQIPNAEPFAILRGFNVTRKLTVAYSLESPRKDRGSFHQKVSMSPRRVIRIFLLLVDDPFPSVRSRFGAHGLCPRVPPVLRKQRKLRGGVGEVRVRVRVIQVQIGSPIPWRSTTFPPLP